MIKTQDYLDVFARFKQKENIEAVERMLASHDELELFERSQLGTFPIPIPLLPPQTTQSPPRRHQRPNTPRRTGSLCCESAEEAKTLIPSISNKISDGDLQELLDDITKLRNFVE